MQVLFLFASHQLRILERCVAVSVPIQKVQVVQHDAHYKMELFLC